jgi:hypothetical protein
VDVAAHQVLEKAAATAAMADVLATRHLMRSPSSLIMPGQPTRLCAAIR